MIMRIFGWAQFGLTNVVPLLSGESWDGTGGGTIPAARAAGSAGPVPPLDASSKTRGGGGGDPRAPAVGRVLGRPRRWRYPGSRGRGIGGPDIAERVLVKDRRRVGA